ncbi:MAG: hypothetical protein RLY70_1521 [Planctomycetota bacterium]|jgi:hypothetical protein
MDEKRRMREEKRELKKSGTRRLRRHLKDPNSDPDDFDYGRKRSEVMNTPRPPRKPARSPSANPNDEPASDGKSARTVEENGDRV